MMTKMGILSNIFNRNNNNKQPENVEQRSYFADALSFNSLSSYTTTSTMRLSAVYAAVNAISNSVATLPINIYNIDTDNFRQLNHKHQLNNLLNYQPSKNFTKFNFFKLLISSVLLNGNAYAIIKKDAKNNVTELRYIHPSLVTINHNNITDTITYSVVGYKQVIPSQDMLHFFMYSNDSISGVSVIQHAVNVLKSAADAETHSSNFFKSGAAANGLLKSSTLLTEDQKRQIRASWQTAFDNTANSVAIIPAGMDYQPISINSKDAQLLESRQYNIVEIARFFNISPVKLFDLSKASYSSLEQTQLSYLQDTIYPYLFMIEQELNRKLFNELEREITVIKFDVTALLTTDKQATAQYYKEMLINGIMTINEVRKALNLNDLEEGNELYMQLNMSTVKNINKGNEDNKNKQLV